MLASAVGPNLTKLLHDQLDLMFSCGLSEALRSALVSIARHIPPLLNAIQGLIFLFSYLSFYSVFNSSALDRLLHMLSTVLLGVPYRPLGTPQSQKPEVKEVGIVFFHHRTVFFIVLQPVVISKNPELTTLALTTLGTFDFSGMMFSVRPRLSSFFIVCFF